MAKTKHGHCIENHNGTATYRAWVRMHDRCRRKTSKDYEHYGGRGITVCPEWAEFTDFLKDMGERPQGHSIERKIVNGNYEPSNCIWATDSTQRNNKTNTNFIEFNGERMSLAQWARKLGMTRKALSSRIVQRHWSVERAFTQDVRGRIK